MIDNFLLRCDEVANQLLVENNDEPVRVSDAFISNKINAQLFISIAINSQESKIYDVVPVKEKFVHGNYKADEYLIIRRK